MPRTIPPVPRRWPSTSPATMAPLPLVLGVMKDKDVDANGRARSSPAVSRFVATQASIAARACRRRSWPSRLRERRSRPCRSSTTRIPRRRSQLALADSPRAIVAGSIFLVGPLRARLLARGAKPVRYPSKAPPFSPHVMMRHFARCRASLLRPRAACRSPLSAQSIPGWDCKQLTRRASRRRSHPADARSRMQRRGRQRRPADLRRRTGLEHQDGRVRGAAATCCSSRRPRDFRPSASSSTPRPGSARSTRRPASASLGDRGAAGQEHVRHARARHLFLGRDDREDRRRTSTASPTAASRPACSRRRAGTSAPAAPRSISRTTRCLRNAVIRVKDVPIFYLPVLYYPIQSDDRATGFLLPTYGSLDLPRPVAEQRLLLGDQSQPGSDADARLVHEHRPGRRQPNTATCSRRDPKGTSAPIGCRRRQTVDRRRRQPPCMPARAQLRDPRHAGAACCRAAFARAPTSTTFRA